MFALLVTWHCLCFFVFFLEKDALHHGFRVEAPIKCLHGRLWVRLSAHVYNDLRDYERLAVAVEAVARAGD